MIEVNKGRFHGSFHCNSCGLPEIDLDTMKRKEKIQLWHLAIGRGNHRSVSVLCWDCLNDLNVQVQKVTKEA